MDFWWPLTLALVGAQAAIVAVSLAGLCLPATSAYSKWVHKHRASLLWAGAAASVLPLVNFGRLAAAFELHGFILHLGATVVLVLAQLGLYLAEDRRGHPGSTKVDHRRRGKDYLV